MAKYAIKMKAIQLRKNGRSIKDIANELQISKGTASLWLRDIVLSPAQREKLKQNSISGGNVGREKGAFIQKKRRLDIIERYQQEGREQFKTVSQNEFFTAGVALYWAEGSKKDRTLSFCNSDPALINFMLRWLKTFFNVETERFRLCVGINEMHRYREDEVKKYWAEITGIPVEQFRKTSFKKSVSSKIYANPEEHYGTLDVRVLKGTELCYRILGLIQGLSSQGSSVG